VKSLIDYATSGHVAAFFAESIQGVGGYVEYPPGYLAHAYAHVRAAGGVCIADEVQTGFGRTGTHFWGFETQGVIPDIVTLAKGIGNGAPLAAVVTTPQIAAVMTQKVHFNTFGGNPVVSAIGQAVLEVIERENTQQNCLELGAHLLAGLEKLKNKYPLIGDVRGRGLLLGVELVTDRATKAPAREACARVVENARELGLLLGKGGLWGQTLRIAPPMTITRADADFLLAVLDEAIGAV
jgi:alanine-glyoxylate transaminase/(R)-3-amino-2-methylpropionate-pyruvate transaminase